jgi:hypothetical protein
MYRNQPRMISPLRRRIFRPRGALLLATGLLFSQLVGCERPMRDAIGTRNQIVLMVDEGTRRAYHPHLEAIWDREVFTPRREAIFTFRVESFERWSFFQRYKNVVITASLEDAGPAGEHLRSMLSDEVRRRLRDEDIGFHVVQRDVYAQDQIVVVIAAGTRDRLQEYLQRNRETLFRIMEEGLNRRVQEALYRYEENHALADTLLTRWQFMVRVPFDYRLNDDYAEHRFVRMIRYTPERYFFAWWVPEQEAQSAGAGWVLSLQQIGERMAAGIDPPAGQIEQLGHAAVALRDSITRRFLDGDVVYPPETTATLVSFNDRWAVRLYGLWRNDQIQVGGPLVSYTFYDPHTRRIWWLDGAVFAPNMLKEAYLRQLEVLMHTFRTGPQAEQGQRSQGKGGT